MPDSGCIKFFTLDEANAVLPRVREHLVALRENRKRIVGLQARIDIEELTLSSADSDRTKMYALMRELELAVGIFHGALAALQDLGCELKDLERGLVDFYSMRGNDVVYLCWMDGESDITWWHPLDTGMKGRAPL